ALKPSTGLIALALALVPLLLTSRWRGRVALLLALAVIAVVAVKGWPGQSPTQYVQAVKQNESLQFLYRAFELDRIISPDNGPASSSGQQATDYVVIHGRRLPRPSEGQPIPSSAIGPALWTPGGPAGEVWRSPTEHQTVFADPRDKRRVDKFDRDVSRLTRVP